MVPAMLSWMYDWDPVTAEREFHYSIALAPSYDCAHEYYSGDPPGAIGARSRLRKSPGPAS